MSLEQTLEQFKETEQGEAFSLQNSKLLKVELADVTIQAKLGSMVAYQGDVHFEHAGSGGISRMVKKAATGEGQSLMKVSGSGEAFLADLAQDIHVIKLENDSITANGANVLAIDADIEWDVKRVEGAGSFLGGGLYNMHLEGSGYVALLSDGPPLMLEIDGEGTYADPASAITWSSGVTTSVKTDVNLKTFIGRGSGEGIQVAFSGQGWVLIQPSEGRIAAVSQSGGQGGGASGAIGKMLGG
jgi:uncharacterized protein (AIM24 family)